MKHEEISLNTKKALAEALKEAMRKKPFQKISVSELVERAGVNRKTFYYHFEDVYALLKWMLEEEAIDVVKHYDLLVDYEEAITFVMNYVEENEHILNCAYDSIGHDQLKRFFCADLHDIVVSLVENAEQKSGKSLEPAYREFLTQFYVEALSGMLLDWVKYRDKRERALVVDYITRTMRSSLIGVLENAEDA